MINRLRFILIFTFVCFFLQVQTAAASVTLEEPWLDDAYGYGRAVQLQRELKVPLVVYFYTDWCPYCRQLDAEYFPNPAVQAYLRGVVKVRINPEHGASEREIADKFGVRGYPRFYVIRTPTALPRNLQPFRRDGASLTPEQFANTCQQFAPVSAPKSVASQMLVNNAKGGAAAITTDTKLPSLDSVLQRYVDALGGKDALAKATTRVFKGKVDLIGVSRGGQLEGYQKAPNRSLMVINLQTLGVIKQGFDGHAGWYFTNQTGTRNMKGQELAAFVADADFYRDLKFRELYPAAKLIGKTKSGFRELYVVQATPRDGGVEYFYFDVESGLLFRRDATRQTSEGTIRAEMYFGDWREVDGIRMPFSITQSMGKATLAFTIEEVKHNVPVEEAVFRRP